MGDEQLSAVEAYLLERGLRIKVVASKGRCLVASRPLKRGDLILEQEPFSSVLDANSSEKLCDGCFSLSENLLRCSACKSVRYCSIVCQRNEWRLHKSECKILGRRPNQEQKRLQTPSLRLMIRLMVKRSLQADGVILKSPVNTFELVEALPTHFSETEPERLVLYAQMSNLVKFVAAPLLEIDVKEVTQLFCRFACNAHTICDEELRPLGTGLYPVISIINHSCSPNAALLFKGKQGVVRCLENIDEGTEVTMSYVELAASTPTRQKTLKDQYYFECCCSRCTRRVTSEGMIEDAILEGYRCLNKQCDGACLPLSDGKRLVCYTCGSIQSEFKMKSLVEAEKLLEAARKAEDSCNTARARGLYEQGEGLQRKVWHRYSVKLMRTRDSLLRICMSSQDWKSALAYCQMTLPAYERAYASHSPLLGLQYYILGKLEWFLGNTKEALRNLRRAMEILCTTHSSSSVIVQELSSLLQEAYSEAAQQEQMRALKARPQDLQP